MVFTEIWSAIVTGPTLESSESHLQLYHSVLYLQRVTDCIYVVTKDGNLKRGSIKEDDCHSDYHRKGGSFGRAHNIGTK